MITCAISHDDCPQLKPSPLPTRVIDVGILTSDQQKLVITNGKLGRYVALSYCWGTKSQPLVTTTSNIHTLCDSVPSSSLAQTIQDAIYLTRKLGLRYIWIDALCIIQDSAADKDNEIKRMGKIYESAFITIVAASAKGCHEGFLHRRSYPWGVQAWVTFNLPFRCPDGTLGELILEPEDPYFTGDQPINHRAWTLQESLLSPRRLIYSTTHLIWQCQSSEATLGSPGRKPDGSWKDTILIQIFPALVAASASASNSSPQQIPAETLQKVRRNWRTIVRNYTSRKLSNGDDVLLGISGIAARFATFLNEQYKAGLWYSPSDESNFIRDLLWYRPKRLGPEESGYDDGGDGSADRYTAPSWSWAAQKSQVTWEFHAFWEPEGNMVCEIEECVVRLATAAPFGQVRSGFLKLRAWTRKLEKVDTGDVVDDLEYLIMLLEEENVVICLDDGIVFLAERFRPELICCVLLTRYGGLLLLPRLDGRWVRIGIFQDQKPTDIGGGYRFDGWFENKEFESVIID
jgi:hypothetical protein